MIVEYQLKGVNPNGKDEHIYEGLFETTGLSLSISKDQFGNIWWLGGYSFHYYTNDRGDLDKVYATLKYVLCGVVEEDEICNIDQIGYFSIISEK